MTTHKKDGFMTPVNPRNFVSQATASVLIALLVAGCASYRMNTSLQPRTPAAPMPAGLQFRIASANFVTPTNVSSGWMPDFGPRQPSNEELRNKLMDSAKKEYPKVFSEKPEAIPVEVSVTRSANTTEWGGEACAACLTLTIIPARSRDTTEYTVQVRALAGPASEKLAAPIIFSREDTWWMSILPTAWIPVPGGKGVRAWGKDSATLKGADLTLSSCVEAIVTAIRRVDTETWQKFSAGADSRREK
jgi:hypothetical protein